MSSRTPGTWRTGTKVGRTLYADDKLIGTLDRPEDAAACAAVPELIDALTEMRAAHQRLDPHPYASCSSCTLARAALAKAGA